MGVLFLVDFGTKLFGTLMVFSSVMLLVIYVSLFWFGIKLLK